MRDLKMVAAGLLAALLAVAPGPAAATGPQTDAAEVVVAIEEEDTQWRMRPWICGIFPSFPGCATPRG